MIKINNLSVSFDKKVIENFSFVFEKGVYAVFGPSGTGKTTLLNAICGLVKFKGEISVSGKISYLFQEDRLLDWFNVEENILLVEPNKEKALAYMNKFGVDEYKEKYPKELSGGMKRRCALVRCLSYEADIILLDEPFRGLDDTNVDIVRKEIKKLAKDKLIIIVTHSEADVEALGAEKVMIK